MPLLLAALLAPIAVLAMILPCICAAAPMDAEEPTMKYTLHGRALFINTTLALAATVKVVEILKMNCFVASPPALSVRTPDKVTANIGGTKEYTPEGMVSPPRFDDGSAAVDTIERALSPSQCFFSLAGSEKETYLL